MILSRFRISKNTCSLCRSIQSSPELAQLKTCSLPRLIVPPLEKTIEKYMKSVTPFLTEEEFCNTKKLIELFKVEAKNLQNHLELRAKSMDNWLEDWWLNTAYLDVRSPVVVLSSPGLVFPKRRFKGFDDRLKYIVGVIQGALVYKLKIDNAEIPTEKMGNIPLDMGQYSKFFGTCRIPQKKSDVLQFNPKSNHIVLIKNNHFFKLTVINSDKKVAGTDQLKSCLLDVFRQSQTAGLPIGMLTADNRDNWAEARDYLCEAHPDNKCSLEAIEKSLFVVCIDNSMLYSGCDMILGARQCLHGDGSKVNGANRWFDKTVQFIVGTDGTSGLTYEHSPSEGQPIATMVDFIVNFIKDNPCMPDVELNGCLEKLVFKGDNLSVYFDRARETLDQTVRSVDLECFSFSDYGKAKIKGFKQSPDSYFQMAMQYAFYGLHDTPAAHYESAMTRQFLGGRTETIRSCSVESVEFAKAMLNKNLSEKQLIKYIKKAIKAHKDYTVDAMNGLGVDRHLLGLKKIAEEKNLPVPQLFNDVSYKRSSHMRLATSQVATKCDGFMAYGPIVKDGYGCCYNPREANINVAISSFTCSSETNARAFGERLQKALKHMARIMCTDKGEQERKCAPSKKELQQKAQK